MKINVDDYLMWFLMNGNRIKDAHIELRMEKASGKENIFSGKICKEKIKSVAADSDRTGTYFPSSEMV